MRALFALASVFAVFAAPKSFPPLGVIDLYGNRTTSPLEVRKALPFYEGDTIQFSQFDSQKRQTEEKLAEIPGVRQAFLTLVCCTADQKSMLYVGIEEDDSPCLQFLPEPVGAVRLPSQVIQASKDVEDAVREAVLKGNTTEDDSQGHALSSDSELRALQLRLVPLAESHLATLKNVLHNSSDDEQRAVAAELLGYVNDKQSVVPDLVAAMKDPSSGVRNNAMRALEVFTKLIPKPPGQKIQVPSQPFTALLNSCIWTDRNKSAAAVAEFTNSRDPALLTQLAKEAFPSLGEMARWKNLGHATSSLIILGRIGGLTEQEISKDLDTGIRQAIIAAAEKVEASHN